MIDAGRIRQILAMSDEEIRALPPSEDVCNLIRCQFITQQQAGHSLLLGCSMLGYVGVLTCDHPICKPYCDAVREEPARERADEIQVPLTPSGASADSGAFVRSAYISDDPGGRWESQDCSWMLPVAGEIRSSACPDVKWFWIGVGVLGLAALLNLMSDRR